MPPLRALTFPLLAATVATACGGAPRPSAEDRGKTEATPSTSTNLRYYTPTSPAKTPQVIEADVVVYGGTSAGVVAAVQAARMGKRAVIAAFGRHLGGLTASGLGATDFGRKASIGGISREFYERVGDRYGLAASFTFEPHVAEEVFLEMVREHDIPVYYEQALGSVTESGQRIVEITMESGDIFRGRIFIDATYEGDLMAGAGVSYKVGRESNATYGETLNGVHFGHPNHNFEVPVDPYVVKGDPSSGLLQGISAEDPGEQGEGDHRVQAYNFRMTLTRNRDNWRPIPKPPGYDPARYELLLRYIRAGVWDALKLTTVMPNDKTDTNNWGGFSTDNIGENYEWPDGDYATRERIFQDHVTYQQGLMWFLCHDERVPDEIRQEVCAWGLPRDEFEETGGWPHQLYVREGRRMISDYVVTEHDARGDRRAQDPVALAAYGMDSHNCQRVVIDGQVKNEGNVEVKTPAPFPVPYRAIAPKRGEADNLLVPVAVSASHIAYGAIRMEPVFMALGQSAATAGVIAIDEDVPVQEVPYPRLRSALLRGGQVLSWDPSMEDGDEAPNPETIEPLEVEDYDPRKSAGSR